MHSPALLIIIEPGNFILVTHPTPYLLFETLLANHKDCLALDIDSAHNRFATRFHAT